MIIGKGLIANLFRDVDSDEVIFFASGVSNSSEIRKDQFLREQNLVEETLANFSNKLFIYFSTCSIYDSSKYNSLYVLHKLHMEEIIKQKASNFLILRVSNAVGHGGNPNLLMNYLFRQIKNNQELTIHRYATRNLIDVEDVKNITLKYIYEKKWSRIVNVAYCENFTIPEIIQEFESVLHVNSIINIIDLGEHYSIDVNELDYKFISNSKKEYLINLITKYYG